MAAKVDAEVIVVGGGPVGLVCALLMARNGVSVTLIEKSATVETDLRASTFHPPTLDMLDDIGLAEGLIAQGLETPKWQIRVHPTGERVIFDLGILAKHTRHPYRLQAEQWKLAQLALAALQKEPTATVIMGAEVTGIAQDDVSVTVTIKDGSGERQLHSHYMVGADGARSVVRGAIGLEFEGQTYPETTLLVTTLFPFEEHIEGLTNVNYCWKAGGNFSLMRVPGRWRMSIYPREDVSIEEQITEKAIQAEMQNILPQPQEYEVMDRRPYRIHKRIVAHYHRGRITLAGDAAHINSPSGGMGLNGGLHDAFELAAAMSDISKGGSAEQRLDLYERRRRPVALEQILAQADANRARMREKDPTKRLEILAGLQAITADPARLEAHLLRTSMIIGLRQAATIN